MVTKNELRKALNFISLHWGRQNNYSDKRSNFIYRVETVDECLQKAQELGMDENYVLHRWYNFHTSTFCEWLFVKHGAIKENDPYNHDIDIYIDDIPYDVKLTVYPAKLEKEGIFFDLNTREGKNSLIRWMYDNQSQEGRKHLKNRLFLVCNAESDYEKLALKCEFDIIEENIRNYFLFLEDFEPNQIIIEDKGKEYDVYSEIISIE